MRFYLMAAAVGAGLCASAGAAPVPPQSGKDPMEAVYACSALTVDAERLACFDREVGQLRQQQDKGQFAAIDSARVETLQKESFGFSIPSLPKLKLPSFNDEALNAQTMTIKSVRSGGSKPVFVMTNGQVWRQIDSDMNRNAREGAEVDIEKAALGSYLLKPKRGGIAIRVRREE